MKNITVAILAGGLGTRLNSVVSDRPKVLADVRGKPFLAYLLDQVAAAGVTRTVLCVGYRGEQVQATFGETFAGMRLVYSQETTLLGTGGSLRLALPLIESETFLAMNGDSFCDVNLMDVWIWHKEYQANATMVLTFKSDITRYGHVTVAPDGQVSRFDEKGSGAGAGYVNAGIYVFKSEMVRIIDSERIVSLERDVFPRWVGQQFYGYQSRGRFLDIGTPESYAQAEDLFASDRK